jgi:hypothetical protein
LSAGMVSARRRMAVVLATVRNEVKPSGGMHLPVSCVCLTMLFGKYRLDREMMGAQANEGRRHLTRCTAAVVAGCMGDYRKFNRICKSRKGARRFVPSTLRIRFVLTLNGYLYSWSSAQVFKS